jgi:hypothetical protein
MEFQLYVIPFSERSNFELPKIFASTIDELKSKLISSWNSGNVGSINAEINLKADITFNDEVYEVWIGTYEVFDNTLTFELNGDVQDFCEMAFDIDQSLNGLDQALDLLFQLS